MGILRKYSIGKGLYKGLCIAGAVAAGILSGVQAVNGAQGPSSVTAAIAIGAIFGAIRVATNWYKLNYKD